MAATSVTGVGGVKFSTGPAPASTMSGIHPYAGMPYIQYTAPISLSALSKEETYLAHSFIDSSTILIEWRLFPNYELISPLDFVFVKHDSAKKQFNISYQNLTSDGFAMLNYWFTSQIKLSPTHGLMELAKNIFCLKVNFKFDPFKHPTRTKDEIWDVECQLTGLNWNKNSFDIEIEYSKFEDVTC